MRLIDKEGRQLGILTLGDALMKAEQDGLDLVEIAPTAQPPVCKIIDYGKYRYQLTKKEKESRKAQHQVRVKEVKLKPNTDDHDLFVKVRHSREFITKGNKVRVVCVFRGREMMYPELGARILQRFCEQLADIASIEVAPKMMGRSLSATLAPGVKRAQEKTL